MFLKCIEMTGFKSFPEKTQMHMNGSITGVVGPNGSGKSNVSDAVRWVLGEQSAKSLRGSVMQDVIFAGTQKRKPRAFCEVSLIFDNYDNRLGSEYSEIEVRRKLYRSGESEYYLNGVKCRLKDILTLFRDTGIGREGYSIIGQGRIDEILSEKSIDRRRVFEEASGIMKYRVRKEEAERKLEKTRNNLLRIEDILLEQKTRIGPLKRQAENAKVYLDLSEKLKRFEVNLFLFNYDKAKAKIAKLKQSQAAIEEDRADKQVQLEAFGAQYSEEQENARIVEETGDALAEKLSGALAEIQRVEGEMNLCAERLLNIEKDSARLVVEADEMGAKTSAATQNEAANALRLGEIETELGQLRQTMQDAGTAVQALGSVYEDRVKVIETVQNEKVESIEKIAEVRSLVSALTQKKQDAQQRAQEVDERLAELAEEHSGAQRGLAEHKATLEAAEQHGGSLRDAFNECVFEQGELKKRIENVSGKLEIARREYTAAASSAKMLAEMKQSFEGYKQSVAQLLTAAKTNSDIGGRIIGTFAQIAQVPPKYETAIETCLGAALQNIVVKDEFDAKHIISFLRDRKIGRVTFLPLEALRERSLNDKERKTINGSGVLGIASELISCEQGCERAAAFLLGRTVIVDSGDTAIRIMRDSSYAFRAVTLNGDVYNPGGAITGGSTSKNRGGLVSQQRRQAELSERAQQLGSKVDELTKERGDAQQRQLFLGEQIEKARKELHDNAIATATGKEKAQALAVAMGHAKEAGEELGKEKETLVHKLASLENEIVGFDALQSDLQQSSDTKSEDYQRLEDEYKKNAAEIEQQKGELHDAEIKIAQLQSERSLVHNDNTRLSEEKSDIEKTKSVRTKTLELNAQSIENLKQLEAELEVLQGEKKTVLDDLKIQQSDILKKRGALSKALSERDQKILKVREELSNIAEKAMQAQFNIEKAETGIETSQNRLWESYELTYANALPLREEIDIKQAQAEAETIKRRIRFMGSVNPNAIEDYAELKERMDALETQKDDLTKAGEDLHNLITSLLSEMRKTFRASFEAINKHFNKAFKDLFDGGRAELLLEDENDIMESGIEIVAEPPGKKLQKISLLSGGEKALTAISLLFALLKINPSPVCILDEIDAALDEANVYKFSDYLKKFAENMQFIVITHRKPTMVICDSLYGFAMEEKGVSKLLSVMLD